MLKEVHRLTTVNRFGRVEAKYMDNDCQCYRCPRYSDIEGCRGKCDFSILLARLAAYEDTGLTPDDIVKLKGQNKALRTKIAVLKDKYWSELVQK